MNVQLTAAKAAMPRVERPKAPTTQEVASRLRLSIVARKPRTSLIDAEWEWLARREDGVDGSDATLAGDSGAPESHVATLPPPPFVPGFEPVAATRVTPTLAHAKQRPPAEPVQSARRLGLRVAALVAVAAGVSLTLGITNPSAGASLLEWVQSPPAAVAARMDLEPASLAVPPLAEPTREPVVSVAAARAPVARTQATKSWETKRDGARFQKRPAVSGRHPRAPGIPGPSRLHDATKRRAGSPLDTDNPY